jgi:hypothetical protein
MMIKLAIRFQNGGCEKMRFIAIFFIETPVGIMSPNLHWESAFQCMNLHHVSKIRKKIDLIFSYLQLLSGLQVVWGGIEPPTQGFSVLCSTN